MNVKLNIENDAELRAYIKDCVKGQVLSIVREDFRNMVMEELERKLKGTDERHFHTMQKAAMIEALKEILYKEHSVSRFNTEFIKPYIEEVLGKAVAGKDWGKLAEAIVKEKIRLIIG